MKIMKRSHIFALVFLVLVIFLGAGKGLTEYLGSSRLQSCAPRGKMVAVEGDQQVPVLV